MYPTIGQKEDAVITSMKRKPTTQCHNRCHDNKVQKQYPMKFCSRRQQSTLNRKNNM